MFPHQSLTLLILLFLILCCSKAFALSVDIEECRHQQEGEDADACYGVRESVAVALAPLFVVVGDGGEEGGNL